MTLIRLRSPLGGPRKLICVCGEASRLPGSGETVTDPASVAEVFNVVGSQSGAAPAVWTEAGPAAGTAGGMGARRGQAARAPGAASVGPNPNPISDAVRPTIG